MAQREVNSGSFKNAFNTARNQGKGLFTWNGKQYNTMKKGENADTFRQQHSDYDQFLGNIASSQGGWHVQNPIDTSYIINKVPKPVTEKSNGVSPSNQVQQNTQLQMFTNDDIRSLGFRNYNGLVSAVGNQANTNNNFVKAMINRYGADTSKWNQNIIENDLGVSGTYRSFGRGDFGDMSRSMASWLGTHNGNLAKQEQERIWNQNAGVKYSLNDNSVLANKYPLSKPSISNNLVNLKFKQGGQMYKYAAGAQMVQPQQAGGQQGMEQQAMALVQAAMQGDQQANQTIQKIMQAAQQGDQQAVQVAKLLQAIAQQMKGSRKARLGAKLDYIKQSIGECPEGQEVVYFKKGGEICKICAGKKMQDGGKSDPIKNFKKKKVNKHQQGGTFKQAFDNAYGKQRYFTWNGKVYAAYKGDKATDQGFQGAIDNLQEQANALKDYNAGSHLGWDPGANKTTAIKHNSKGNMQGVVNDVVITGRRISPRQKANNQRKRYFDQWTAYVKKWHPNMLGRFKNTMQNMGYKYDWNTGIYSKSGSSYRLNNGQLQTQNIYTGNWSNINNSDALPGMPANGLSMRLQK